MLYGLCSFHFTLSTKWLCILSNKLTNLFAFKRVMKLSCNLWPNMYITLYQQGHVFAYSFKLNHFIVNKVAQLLQKILPNIFGSHTLQKLLENKLTTTIIYLHGWFSLKSDEWRSHSFFHFHYILRNCAWMVLRPYLSEQIFSGKRKRPPLAVSSSSLYIYMLEEKVIINAGSIEDALKK